METIEVHWPDANAYLERLEHAMELCRKRAIKALAKECGITIEEATKVADEVTEKWADRCEPINLAFKVEY